MKRKAQSVGKKSEEPDHDYYLILNFSVVFNLLFKTIKWNLFETASFFGSLEFLFQQVLILHVFMILSDSRDL